MATALLNPSSAFSINQYFRKKRFLFFLNLLKTIKSDRTIQILDIGGTETYWERMGFSSDETVHITLLNLELLQIRNSSFTSVQANACDLSRYPDDQFDIVFSNSVIEHLFTFENQQKMANEVRRVGKNFYVQTPNYYFPLEPHWLFPFFQFLPFNVRVFLTQNFSLGHHPKCKDKAAAIERVKEVQLLSEKQMKRLFPEGKVYRERFLGLTKSVSMYCFPGK